MALPDVYDCSKHQRGSFHGFLAWWSLDLIVLRRRAFQHVKWLSFAPIYSWEMGKHAAMGGKGGGCGREALSLMSLFGCWWPMVFTITWARIPATVRSGGIHTTTRNHYGGFSMVDSAVLSVGGIIWSNLRHDSSIMYSVCLPIDALLDPTTYEAHDTLQTTRWHNNKLNDCPIVCAFSVYWTSLAHSSVQAAKLRWRARRLYLNAPFYCC